MTPAAGRRPIAFLDRDGTLIEEADYLADPEGVVLLDGVPAALGRLRAAGWALVVVTNQSGIARGLYGEDDYRRVADRLETLLDAAGTPVDLTVHCPHHPDHTGPCPCRKPAPGMLLAAARALGLDAAHSVTIGDKAADVLAGRAVGGGGILVRTGYGRTSEGDPELPPGTPVVESLTEAVDLVLASPRVVDRPGGPG